MSVGRVRARLLLETTYTRSLFRMMLDGTRLDRARRKNLMKHRFFLRHGGASSGWKCFVCNPATMTIDNLAVFGWRKNFAACSLWCKRWCSIYYARGRCSFIAGWHVGRFDDVSRRNPRTKPKNIRLECDERANPSTLWSRLALAIKISLGFLAIPHMSGIITSFCSMASNSCDVWAIN